jgi:uncharacterized membrane protein (DUF485 family)
MGRKREAELKHKLEARVELFKTVATFGFLAVVVLYIGVPLVFGYVPGLSGELGFGPVVIAGYVGIGVVGLVIASYVVAAVQIGNAGTSGKN